VVVWPCEGYESLRVVQNGSGFEIGIIRFRAVVPPAKARLLNFVLDNANQSPGVMIVSLRVIARTPDDRRHVELGRTVEHVAAVGGRAALLELRLDTFRLP